MESLESVYKLIYLKELFGYMSILFIGLFVIFTICLVLAFLSYDEKDSDAKKRI
jgi:hypothetical protein